MFQNQLDYLSHLVQYTQELYKIQASSGLQGCLKVVVTVLIIQQLCDPTKLMYTSYQTGLVVLAMPIGAEIEK